jgi:hypothetical protein
MNVRLYAKLMSRFAFALSLIAVATCFKPAPYLFYGMMCSIIGTLLAVTVIFIRARYGVPTKWNHISYITVVLASVPVVYVMVLLFIVKA